MFNQRLVYTGFNWAGGRLNPYGGVLLAVAYQSSYNEDGDSFFAFDYDSRYALASRLRAGLEWHQQWAPGSSLSWTVNAGWIGDYDLTAEDWQVTHQRSGLQYDMDAGRDPAHGYEGALSVGFDIVPGVHAFTRAGGRCLDDACEWEALLGAQVSLQ